MAQNPMMGAPIQPAASSSPTSLSFQSDPANRASFKGFMTSLSALPNISTPPVAPMPAPMVPAADVDIFQPMPMEMGGAVPMRTDIAGQPHMLSYITPGEADVLKAMGGAGKPGPGGIPSFYYDAFGTGSVNDWGGGGYSYSDDSPSVIDTGSYDPVGTGTVDDPGWSSGAPGYSDDSGSNIFGSTPTPAPVYYDSFGNVHTTQAGATAADNLAAQQAAEAAAAEAARAEAARIEQANQQQAVDIALSQAASQRQRQLDDALQATTIAGGDRPQVSLTAGTPQQGTVYSKDVVDVDPFAMPGSAPAFAESLIQSSKPTGYTPEPTGYDYDVDLLGLTDPRAEMNLLQDEALAKDLTSRMGGVNVNPVTGEITPVSTPMDAGEFNIKPDRGDALAKEITASGGIVDVNPETGQIIGNFPNTPSQSLLTNVPAPDSTGDLVDIALPQPRPGTLVDYDDPTKVPVEDSGLSAPVPSSTLSTSVPFGEDDEYTGMQGVQVPVGTISPDERDEEVVSALSDDFLDEQGRADLNVLAGEAIDYFNNPLVKGIQAIEGISPLSALMKGLTGRQSLVTTNAGLPAGRIGNMQLGIQQGGRLVQDDSGNPLYVEMPDGTRIGENLPPQSTDESPMIVGPADAGAGTSAAAQEVEEIIKGLSGIGTATSGAPVTTTITSTPTTPAQGGLGLGLGYGQMKQTPTNLDRAMENFFKLMGGYAEGGEVKNFAKGGSTDDLDAFGGAGEDVGYQGSGYGTYSGGEYSAPDSSDDNNYTGNVQTVIAQPVQNEVVVPNPTPTNMQTASEILQKNEALAAKGMQAQNPITRMISSLIAPSPETQAVAASMNKLSSTTPSLLNADLPTGGSLTSVPVAAQYADYKPTAAGIEQGIQGLSQVGRERPSSGFSIPKIDLGAIAERIMGTKPTYDNLSKFTTGFDSSGKAAPFTVRPDIRPGYMGVRANIPF